jgi:hypothetical protein
MLPGRAGRVALAETAIASGSPMRCPPVKRSVPPRREAASHLDGTLRPTLAGQNTVKNTEHSSTGATAPAGKNLAFTGEFVRAVSESQLSRWLEGYSTLDRWELKDELERCDHYYAHGVGAGRFAPKDWFQVTAAWLGRVHDRRMAEARKEQAAMDELYRSLK